MAFDWLAISLSVYSCLRIISWVHYYVQRILAVKKEINEYRLMAIQQEKFLLDDPFTLFSSVAIIVSLLQLIKLKYDVSIPFKKIFKNIEAEKTVVEDKTVDNLNDSQVQDMFLTQTDQITKSIDQLIYRVNTIDTEFCTISRTIRTMPDIFMHIKSLEERIHNLESEFQDRRKMIHNHESELFSESYYLKDRNCGCGDWGEHSYPNQINKCRNKIVKHSGGHHQNSCSRRNESLNNNVIMESPTQKLQTKHKMNQSISSQCPVTLSKASSKSNFHSKRTTK